MAVVHQGPQASNGGNPQGCWDPGQVQKTFVSMLVEEAQKKQCFLGGLEISEVHRLAELVADGTVFRNTTGVYISVRGANASTIWPGSMAQYSVLAREALCALGHALETLDKSEERGDFELTLRVPAEDMLREDLECIAAALGEAMRPNSPFQTLKLRPPGAFDGVQEFERLQQELRMRTEGKRMAILMGTHDRLGSASPLMDLPMDILDGIMGCVKGSVATAGSSSPDITTLSHTLPSKRRVTGCSSVAT